MMRVWSVEGDPLEPHEAGIPAVVADVEFGGKHLDVMLDADTDKRLLVRVDIRRSASFLQALGRGDRVVVRVRHGRRAVLRRRADVPAGG